MKYNPIINKECTAVANIKGGPLAPNIQGLVCFTKAAGGTNVCVDITGLPPYKPGSKKKDPIGPHGFHIHENGTCKVGDPEDPFQAAGGHWNPDNEPHGCVPSLVSLSI